MRLLKSMASSRRQLRALIPEPSDSASTQVAKARPMATPSPKLMENVQDGLTTQATCRSGTGTNDKNKAVELRKVEARDTAAERQLSKGVNDRVGC